MTHWVQRRVVDVSDPRNPQQVGLYQTRGDAYDIALRRGYASVAIGEAGLQVVDVSDPRNPQEAGFYDTPGWAYGVTLRGDYAYVADERAGLLILRYSGACSSGRCP